MIDFTLWDGLLHQYVDDRGRVNYRDWQQEAIVPLQQWLDEMGSVDLGQYPDPNQPLALWLNLYNALTIRQILQQYPIASIQPRILSIPNWIAFFNFFSRPLFSLGGRQYSLNGIEHTILRPTFADPRIHFALVCASLGCPLLRPEAYWPDRVQHQLDEDAHRFIQNPEKVCYIPEENVLYCSKIFKWYRQDFLKVAPSIPAYLHPYLPDGTSLTNQTTIRYLPYDWTLNERSP